MTEINDHRVLKNYLNICILKVEQKKKDFVARVLLVKKNFKFLKLRWESKLFYIYIHICLKLFWIYSSPFQLATTQSLCLMVIGRDGGLSTLCHSCGFACQDRVLKTFPGPGYLCFGDGVWHVTMTFLCKFGWIYIYYTHLAFMKFEHSVCCGSLMIKGCMGLTK